jgi:CheY-like chemotaxis protein
MTNEKLNDETEQVTREQNASRRAKKRCAEPVDSTPHSAFQIDRKGNIACANSVMHHSFGYDPEHIDANLTADLIAVAGDSRSTGNYLPASAKTSETKTDENANSSADKGRVLLMDDNDMFRDMANQMLDLMGYEVGLAGDGYEAIKLYEDAMQAGNPFDAVILDLTVPGGLGGKETINVLIETDPAVKAILSSGSYNDPVFSNFREYGFSALLPKPYNMADLRETLQKVLLTTSG